MKAGFAALGRRIAKLEADAPRRDGLILVKSGMRGVHEAIAQVVELRRQGLLAERDPSLPPSPMMRLRAHVLAVQQRRCQVLGAHATVGIAEPKESPLKAATVEA